MKEDDPPHLAKWIEDVIRDFVASPENTLCNDANDTAWDAPLVGFSRGDDPLYRRFKEMIGGFYWEPVDVLRDAFPGIDAGEGEISVISWILPQGGKTKEDNREEDRFGCERWVRARKFGEDFNVKLREHVVKTLAAKGFDAVAPQLSPRFAMMESPAYGISSPWSERHAAYVAGLGTFGLCDGLITPVGKAMRAGSVVVRAVLPPSERPYEDHRAHCLFFNSGTCGACIARCPAGAISKEGHDKKKCLAYLHGPIATHAREAYGVEAYGCGLCQTKVPCESRIPARKEK